MYREPLGPLTPILESNGGVHAMNVSATTGFSRIIEWVEETEMRVGEMGVNAGEIEEGDAWFREQDEPSVGLVEQGGCQEAALCVDHRWAAPFHYLLWYHFTSERYKK